MANTYSSIFYHIVFSTKNRENWIDTEIENRVWAYIGGIARKHNCTAIQIGGIDDHIHALILSPPKFSASQIAQFLKGDSSKWIHEKFPKMAKFGWQDGYGAFSVRKKNSCRKLLSILKISENITKTKVLKKNIWNCWNGTKLMLLMRNIYSADSVVADATNTNFRIFRALKDTAKFR